MEAQELRTGNYLRTTTQHREGFVVGIIPKIDWLKDDVGIIIHTKSDQNEECDINYECNVLEPIPLTEEWLIKLGLKYITNNGSYAINIRDNDDDDDFGELCLYDNLEVWLSLIDDSYRINHIKFVHQLQNLYFALTGKELEIK
jgi:hypothetical protein